MNAEPLPLTPENIAHLRELAEEFHAQAAVLSEYYENAETGEDYDAADAYASVHEEWCADAMNYFVGYLFPLIPQARS